MIITSAPDLKKYYQNSLKSARSLTVGLMLLSLVFFSVLGYFSGKPALFGVGVVSGIGVALFHRIYYGKSYSRIGVFDVKFPDNWRVILAKHSLFYRNLNTVKK